MQSNQPDAEIADKVVIESADSSWLRSGLIAPWWEVLFVTLVILGPSLSGSIHEFVFHLTKPASFLTTLLDNSRLIWGIAFEAFNLAGLLAFLHLRGWKPADVRVRIGWTGTLMATILALAGYYTPSYVSRFLTDAVLACMPHPQGFWAYFVQHSGPLRVYNLHLSWFVIACTSLLNGFYEELIDIAYLFNQFAAKYGPAAALAATVLLRITLHSYQGLPNALGQGAFGLVYGLTYWYFRRVWPLILAHALDDALTFGTAKIYYGL